MPDGGRTNLEAMGRRAEPRPASVHGPGTKRGAHPLESARMPQSAPLEHEGKSARMFWWLCAVAGPPLALAAAAAGYGMAPADPLRDLALIALASVAEEIVFRGAVQPALAKWFARRAPQGGERRRLLTPANAVTSLLFAAFHLWRHPLVVAVAIFPVSLVLGRARELSGRTWPAAALHVYFNLLLYAASALLAGGR